MFVLSTCIDGSECLMSQNAAGLMSLPGSAWCTEECPPANPAPPIGFQHQGVHSIQAVVNCCGGGSLVRGYGGRGGER